MTMTEEELKDLELQRLAAAQVGNPKNPYLAGFTPAGGTSSASSASAPASAPASTEPGNVGGGYRVDQYGRLVGTQPAPVAVNPESPYAPSSGTYHSVYDARSDAPPTPGYLAYDEQGKPYAVGRQPEASPAEPQKGPDSGHSQLPIHQNPVFTSSVATHPTVPGAVAISPERQRFSADNEVEGKRKGLLDQDVAVDAHNKNLLQTGLDAADKAIKIRDANYELDKMSESLAKYQIDQADKERKRQLDQEAQEARVAKVDPNHWFKERGTAGSILAAISVAAGAFAAAMPHTGSHENFAMKIIDDSINRDIDAQKDAIANKWKNLDFQSNQNDKEYVRGHYMLNQMQEARYKAFDHASALVNEAKAGTNDQVAISNLDKLGTAIESKKLDLDADRNKRMYEVQKYEQAQAASAANSNPYSAVNLEKDWKAYVNKTLEEQANNPKASGPISKEAWLASRTRGGTGATGAPKLESKEQESVNASDEFIKAADRANAILKDTSYANSPKGRAELNQLQRNLSLAYPRTQTGSTRINEAELKKADETFRGLGGTIRSDMLGTTGVTLEVLKQQAKDRKQKILSGKGGVPTEVPDARPVGE